MALLSTPESNQNFQLPHFQGLGLDNQIYTQDHFSKNRTLLVMFICNHCPYVMAIEDRLILLNSELKQMNVDVLAISSNDATIFPDDSFLNLQKRWLEKKMNWIYLYDENQTIAKSFAAVCTPDFFVFDKNKFLKYRGRLDDSWKNPEKVKRRELLEAIQKINKNENPEIEIPSMGCSIKWKN